MCLPQHTHTQVNTRTHIMKLVRVVSLFWRIRYDIEVPDSYEQLLHDVIDGDNHLFMRSDEVGAGWNILSTVLQEMEKKNIAVELYKLGSKGPDKAADIWAKHGVEWLEDE